MAYELIEGPHDGVDPKNPLGAYGQKWKLYEEWSTKELNDSLKPISGPVCCKGLKSVAFMITNLSTTDPLTDLVIKMTDVPDGDDISAVTHIDIEEETNIVHSVPPIASAKVLPAETMAMLKIQEAGLLCKLQLFAKAGAGKIINTSVLITGERLI